MINKRLRSSYVILLYAVIAACFLLIVSHNQSGYNTWILDGILVPTGIFVLFSLSAETFIKDNKKLVIIAAIFVVSMNLIPGLRYQTFYGVFDTPGHYRFVEQISSLGYIPEGEFYSETYGNNPGMHIVMASLSIISGISVNDIFRLIFPVLWGMFPILTYFVTKNVLDETIQRYVIILTSFPIFQGYIVYGTNLALIPFFLLISLFIRYTLAQARKKTYFLLFCISSFTVIIVHGVTPLIASFVLIGILVFLSLFSKIRKNPAKSLHFSALLAPCLVHVTILWAWWVNLSSFNLYNFAMLIKSVTSPSIPAVPTRFYEISLLPQLQILMVTHIANAIMFMLSLFGVIILLKQLITNKLSHKLEAFYSYIVVLLGLIATSLFVQMVSNFGNLQYDRLITYMMPFTALLGGWVLCRFDKFLSHFFKKIFIVNKLIFVSAIFIVFSLCLIQFFPCQPLVPKASVLSTSLPEDEYIVNFVVVNTVYQINMISFAESHSYTATIASDQVTRNQIHGFSSPSFFSRHTWFSPIVPNQQVQNFEWDLLLLHTTKAGPFSEPAEYRTEEKIEEFRQAGSLIYNNGESFIVANVP